MARITIASIIIVAAMLMGAPAEALDLTGGDSATQGLVDTHQYFIRLAGAAGPLAFEAERRYGEAGEVVSVDSWSGALEYDVELSWRWTFWIDERYSETLTVPGENLVGGGPKFYFVREESAEAEVDIEVTFSAGVLHKWTKHADGSEDSSAVYSIRPKFKYERNDLTVSAVAFYIQDMEDGFVSRSARLWVKYKLDNGDHVGLLWEGEARAGMAPTSARYLTFTVSFGG